MRGWPLRRAPPVLLPVGHSSHQRTPPRLVLDLRGRAEGHRPHSAPRTRAEPCPHSHRMNGGEVCKGGSDDGSTPVSSRTPQRLTEHHRVRCGRRFASGSSKAPGDRDVPGGVLDPPYYASVASCRSSRSASRNSTIRSGNPLKPPSCRSRVVVRMNDEPHQVVAGWSDVGWSVRLWHESGHAAITDHLPSSFAND